MKKTSTVVSLPFRGTVTEPPRGLKKAGQALWNDIQAQYAISDPGGISHLVTCMPQ